MYQGISGCVERCDHSPAYHTSTLERSLFTLPLPDPAPQVAFLSPASFRLCVRLDPLPFSLGQPLMAIGIQLEYLSHPFHPSLKGPFQIPCLKQSCCIKLTTWE